MNNNSVESSDRPYSSLNETEQTLLQAFSDSKNDTSFFAEWTEVNKLKKDSKNERLIGSIGQYRLYLLKLHKKKLELIHEIPYLMIKSIEVTDKDMKLAFEHHSEPLTLGLSGPNALEFIIQIYKILAQCFPKTVEDVLEWKFTGANSRVLVIGSQPGGNSSENGVQVQCGNFPRAYRMVCDLEGVETRRDIVWDIVNLWENGKIFTFKEVAVPVSDKDIKCLLSALRFNHFFTLLDLEYDDKIPLEKEFSILGEALRFNRTLTQLRLTKFTTIDDKTWENLFTSLQKNPHIEIHSLELEDCSWESSKVPSAIAQWITSLQGNGGKNYLSELIIKNCSVSLKKPDLFESLIKQSNIITKLDLEGLKIDPTLTEPLLGFISQSKALSFLNLNHTGITLPPLFAALSESKSQIKKLTIVGNQLKKKQIIQPMVDYLSQVAHLEEFDMSGLEFPNTSQTLEQVLKSIFQNKQLSHFSLLMNNINLEKNFEQVTKSFTPKPQVDIKKWSLKTCELGDEGIRTFLKALDISGLEELDLSFNLKHIKSHEERVEREITIRTLADYLLTHPLKTLRFSGNGKGVEIGIPLTFLFQRLSTPGPGENVSVVLLDLYGNNSGDEGCLALSKLLQKNNSITTIYFDKNNTGLRGFEWMKQGLIKNQTLKTFDAPIADIHNLPNIDIKERATNIWREIEEILNKRKQKEKKNKKEDRVPGTGKKPRTKREAAASQQKDGTPSSPILKKKKQRSGSPTREPSAGSLGSSLKTSSEQQISQPKDTPLSENSQGQNISKEKISVEKGPPSRPLPSLPPPNLSSSDIQKVPDLPLQNRPNKALSTSRPNPAELTKSAQRQHRPSAVPPPKRVEQNQPPAVMENSPQPPQNMLLVQDLKNKLGNMNLAPPPEPITTAAPATNIVQDEDTGITYSVAPRLDIPRRTKGPAKRPPTNISSSDK